VSAPTEPVVIVVAGGDMVCAYPLSRQSEAGSVGMVLVGANLDVTTRRMPPEVWTRVRDTLRAKAPHLVVRDFTGQAER
jgi:hypothetical protein